MTFLQVAGGIALIGLAAIVAYCFAYYRANRNIYRPLSQRQPERRSGEVPLGMEAMNMDLVNKVARRNEALERGHTNWTRKRSGYLQSATDTDIDPMVDDETYAARYFSAFQKDKTKD